MSRDSTVEQLLPADTYSQGFLAVIDQIPVLDSEQTSWGVVQEIRKDREMLQRCRRLRGWVFQSLKAHNYAEAQDEICIRIDDYTKALTKHGATTREGAFKLLFDNRNMPGTLAAALAGSLTGGAIAAAGAAVVSLAGQYYIRFREARRELASLPSTPSGEVAYILDLQKQLAQPNESSDLVLRDSQMPDVRR